MAIAGRQKVDYGGYGGMTVRMNPDVKEFSIRAVHPNPDKWRGDDLAIVQRVTDPAALGDAAWMALYGKYPAAGVETPDFTTVMMFESKATPLYPEQFPLLRLHLYLAGLSGEDDRPARQGQAARLQHPLCDLRRENDHRAGKSGLAGVSAITPPIFASPTGTAILSGKMCYASFSLDPTRSRADIRNVRFGPGGRDSRGGGNPPDSL